MSRVYDNYYFGRAALTAPFRDDNLQVRVEWKGSNSIWCVESPVSMVIGETRTFTVTYLGQTAVSSPSFKIYDAGADKTATFTEGSGTATASGNIVTLEPIKTGDMAAGKIYIVAVTATIGGNTDIRKFQINTARHTDPQRYAWDKSWIVESPVVMVAGETRTFTVTYPGQMTISAVVAYVYKNGVNISATVMPSGSASASGNVATLKPMTAVVGGERYMVLVKTAIGPNNDYRRFMVAAVKASEEQ